VIGTTAVNISGEATTLDVLTLISIACEIYPVIGADIITQVVIAVVDAKGLPQTFPYPENSLTLDTTAGTIAEWVVAMSKRNISPVDLKVWLIRSARDPCMPTLAEVDAADAI
jgi:hypothetical protein